MQDRRSRRCITSLRPCGRCSGSSHGGGSTTQGQTGNDFDNGWTIGTGVLIRPDPTQPFALRVEVNYTRSDANDQFIAQNETATNTPIDHGSLQTVTGFVDGVLEAPLSPWARLYATGGVGWDIGASSSRRMASSVTRSSVDRASATSRWWRATKPRASPGTPAPA